MGKIIGTYLMPHPPILIPEIGCGEEKKAEATIKACELIGNEIKELEPDVIIVITPHGPIFRDAVAVSRQGKLLGNLSKFGAKDMVFEKTLNIEITDEIISNAQELSIPVVSIDDRSRNQYNINCELDHGSMVPLYFVDRFYDKYKLVHITYGLLSPLALYKFGIAIKRAVKELNYDTVVIASGDLSHKLSDAGPYEYSPMGSIFDKTIIKLLREGRVKETLGMDKKLVEDAGECGLRAIDVLLGALDGNAFRGEVLSYEGPYGVGYGVVKLIHENAVSDFILSDYIKEIKAQALEGRKESPEVRLARESLLYYLMNRKYMEMPVYANHNMRRSQSGVFVSMKKDGKLRGCVGTILPVTDSIGEEIIRNAVEAGEHDMRFSPVSIDEIYDITFSVDVLTKPVKASKEELNPQKYGVIVSHKGRRGLLLPDLEGVDTVEQQLDIALKKGGIDAGSDYTIEKFEIVRYK